MKAKLEALVALIEHERKKPALLMVYSIPRILDQTIALLELMCAEIDCQRHDLDLIASQKRPLP